MYVPTSIAGVKSVNSMFLLYVWSLHVCLIINDYVSCVMDGNDILIGDNFGYMYSINKSSGNINWKTKTNYKIVSSPSYDDSAVYIANLGGEIYSLNKNNGETIKSIELEGRAKLSPVYYRNFLFIGFDAGIVRAYEFVD